MPEPKREPIKLPQDAEEFLNHLRDERRASEHTLRAYREDLSLFLGFLDFALKGKGTVNVNHFDIRAFLKHQMKHGYSIRTLRRRISVLRSFYKFLLKKGRLTANPALSIKGPSILREDQSPPFLTHSQIRTLFEIQFESVRDRLVFELLYYEGLTISELFGLNAEHIDFSKKEILISGRKHRKRTLPLSSHVEVQLRAYLARCEKKTGPLFINERTGKRMGVRDLRRIVNYYLSKIPNTPAINPYILRHSFAIHMIEKGADPIKVGELLGFTSTLSKDIYVYAVKKLKGGQSPSGKAEAKNVS